MYSFIVGKLMTCRSGLVGIYYRVYICRLDYQAQFRKGRGEEGRLDSTKGRKSSPVHFANNINCTLYYLTKIRRGVTNVFFSQITYFMGGNLGGNQGRTLDYQYKFEFFSATLLCPAITVSFQKETSLPTLIENCPQISGTDCGNSLVKVKLAQGLPT